jgi:hypothetical protein
MVQGKALRIIPGRDGTVFLVIVLTGTPPCSGNLIGSHSSTELNSTLGNCIEHSLKYISSTS